jgi:hypothetical protein
MYVLLLIECRTGDHDDAQAVYASSDDALEESALAVERLISLALLQEFSSVKVLEVTLHKWSLLDE